MKELVTLLKKYESLYEAQLQVEPDGDWDNAYHNARLSLLFQIKSDLLLACQDATADEIIDKILAERS